MRLVSRLTLAATCLRPAAGAGRSRRGHLVIPILSALRSPPVNFRIDSATGFFFKSFAWSGSCLPVN